MSSRTLTGSSFTIPGEVHLAISEFHLKPNETTVVFITISPFFKDKAPASPLSPDRVALATVVS